MGTHLEYNQPRESFPRPDLTYVRSQVVQFVVPEVGALHRRNFTEHERARAEGRASHIGAREKTSESMETTNIVDVKADELLQRRLTALIPSSIYLSEDSLSTAQDPRLRKLDVDYLRQVPILWVVDPTDGTGRFESYSKQFSTSIALVMHGQVVLGVVHKPMDALTWWAQADEEGAFRDGTPIGVSEKPDLRRAAISTAYAWDIRYRSRTTKLLDKRISKHLNQPALNTASSVLDLLEVSEGTSDGHFSYGLKPWDMAAVSIIIEKGGGRVTTLNGDRWDPFYDNILATNGLIHDDLVTIINTRHLLFSLLRYSTLARQEAHNIPSPRGIIFSAFDHARAGVQRVRHIRSGGS